MLSTYTAATRRLVLTSPEGRQQFATLDAKGRLIAAQAAGLDSVRLSYDSRGRLSQEQVGGRLWTYSYDVRGRLLSTLDPLGQRDSLFYDDADRLIRRVLPDGRAVLLDYDPNGNLASLTPPGRPEHGFQYTAVDLERQYDPPGIPGPKPTMYFYNLDRQLDSIVRPDSIAIRFGYDAAGRTGSVTFDRGTLTFGYSPSSGNLVGMRAPTGDSLTFSYDGSLPIEVRWVGNVNGRVGVTYDNNFRVADQTVNGANAVSFGYDRDGLLTSAGALRLGLSAFNGLLVADTLGTVLGSYQYTSHGELTGHRVTTGGAALFATGYARDSLGRIVQLFDTLQGVPMRWSFVYDSVGRLAADTVNGAIFHAFTYDANGNRLSFTSSNGTINYTYDDQDRLLSAGTTSYTYGSNGELKTKTVPGVGTTTYTYDALGNLVTVLLPDGTRIDYVIDGQNRRVGKKINGVLQLGWLWYSQLAPVGELNGSGALVSRFVYATRINVPDYMVKDGQTYRMVLDHLGSVRLVVNVANGTVAQRLDYDEFGRVTVNTNPGFQPFGYAGGLSDDQTDLVRFGRRDYDPTSGRWTTKDPIRFGGGEENLYVYVGNDPLTWSDPTGLKLYDKCKVADFLKRLLATLPSHNWYPGGIRNDGLFNPYWPSEFDPKADDLNDPTHKNRLHDYYEVDGMWLRSDQFGNFAAGYALQRLYGTVGGLGAHGGGMGYARKGKAEQDPYSESLLDLESWPMIDLGADYGFRDAGWTLGMNARFGLPYFRKLTDPCGCKK
jgi:RHS repeat-associated protein